MPISIQHRTWRLNQRSKNIGVITLRLYDLPGPTAPRPLSLVTLSLARLQKPSIHFRPSPRTPKPFKGLTKLRISLGLLPQTAALPFPAEFRSD